MGEYGTTYNSQYLANAIKEGSITSNRMHPITGVDDGHDQKKQITHFKYLLKNNLVNIGVPDKMIPHGSQDEILSELGLDALGIEKITNDHVDNMVKISSKK